MTISFIYHIIPIFISIPIHKSKSESNNKKHIYSKKQDGNVGEGCHILQAFAFTPSCVFFLNVFVVLMEMKLN